ncbi:hypothetical protein PIB30_031011 [Stylosanthes scabra]|uniref:Uncharacterized protein n=1 Tax=Stylosanthes scabra TaxID=79078 RepID=A0ABU6WA81_9FABA|nr:hypothetical protein [Stylosanthes scabra]
MPLATDIHPLPTLENCMVLCARGDSDITSRFPLEVVQQGPRLAHSCPSSEVCCRGPIPWASLQFHCLTRHPALPRVRHIHRSWGVTLYSAASLRDRLHGVLVSFREVLSPAILKFYRFFGGRVNVTASFTGTSGVGVGICTAVFDHNVASLGEARVGS